MNLVENFLEYLSSDKGYSPLTIVTYKTDLLTFELFFKSVEEGLEWSTIDSDIIRRWMAHRMENSISPRTVKRSLSALHSFYRYLMKIHVVSSDPSSKIINPKVPKNLPTFVKQDEMDRLFEQIEFKDDFAGMRNRLILLTFYSTGIRLSELISLNVRDVDFDRMELKVTGKRNKQRIVPFGRELAEAFEHYLKKSKLLFQGGDTPIFITQKKCKRMKGYQVRDIVKKYLSLVTTQ